MNTLLITQYRDAKAEKKFNQEVLIGIKLECLRIILFVSFNQYNKSISQTLEKNAKLTWDSRKRKENPRWRDINIIVQK